MAEIMFDPNTLCPRMPIQEAVERGFLPEDILDGIKALDDAGYLTGCRFNLFVTSMEGLQDFQVRRKALFSIRTPPITDKEVAEWHRADAMLNLENETFDQKKERLLKLGFKIEGNEAPYQTYDDWFSPTPRPSQETHAP